MRIELKSLHLENFMNYANKTVDFAEVTRISGGNGLGKSSIMTGYMWLLFNCDYELRDNPNVRREINGQAVNDMDVVVEAVFDIDGKEVTARKVQKRKFSKDGKSYSDDNTYFIYNSPKTLRDYNKYFGADMDMLRLCSNINAALIKKPKELRDFLFSTVTNITDRDVVAKFDDMAPLAELLEKYSLEELIAMNKASKAKVSKELPILEGQIKEKERDCTVDIDLAELELQRNGLKEQIAEVEGQIEDSEKANAEYQKKADEIDSLKRGISDIERQAAEKLRMERAEIQRRIDTANAGFEDSRQKIRMAELDIQREKSAVDRYTQEKLRFKDEWTVEKAKAYVKYEELPELPADALVCPACGQMLPEEMKSAELEKYEERRCKHKEQYEAAKKSFEEDKAVRLADIVSRGNRTVEAIEECQANLETATAALNAAKEESIRCNKAKADAMTELAALSESLDLSDNQEYESMVAELQNKKAALEQTGSGAAYRSQLKLKLSGLSEELSMCEKELAKADVTEAEKRLEELRQQRLDLEQSKADCERILYLCDELDKHKNEMLADGINAQFQCVEWRLWEENKSGGYKSVCVPTIDKKSILDIASNKGNRILGKLDICNSIQKITGITAPVFLDDAESLDANNTGKLLNMMDCQVILLRVTDSKELEVI